MNKIDKILVITVLAIAIILSIILMNPHIEGGATVFITVDGEIVGKYLLEEDGEVDINHTNTVVIKNKVAKMSDSTCPNQLCVEQKSIDKAGQMIVCLPNKIMVEVISGSEELEIDGVTN